METMRKEWGSPISKFQMFTPQEFVAQCIPVENLTGKGLHFDFYSRGQYGVYDGQNDERITGAFGPAAMRSHGGESFQIDVYRWCSREKPTYWGDNNWDELWTPETCNHRWSDSGPTGSGQPWTYYDGHDSMGWNSINGHFVKVATNATLKVSASGNAATIIGTLDGFPTSVSTNAS